MNEREGKNKQIIIRKRLSTILIEREIKIFNFAEMVSLVCCPFIKVAVLQREKRGVFLYRHHNCRIALDK